MAKSKKPVTDEEFHGQKLEYEKLLPSINYAANQAQVDLRKDGWMGLEITHSFSNPKQVCFWCKYAGQDPAYVGILPMGDFCGMDTIISERIIGSIRAKVRTIILSSSCVPNS